MFRKKLALLLLPIVVGVGLGVFLFNLSPANADVTGVAISDIDNVGYGLNGQDFQITWTPGSAPSGYMFTQMFILPSTTAFSLDTLNTACGGEQCMPLGMLNSYSMATWTLPMSAIKDSAGNNFVTNTQYVAWVLVSSTVPQLVSSSPMNNLAFDIPADNTPPMIMHMSVNSAKAGLVGYVYALVTDDQTQTSAFASPSGQVFTRLFYKTGADWITVNGSHVSGTPNVFEYVIPSNIIGSNGNTVEYYLGSRDAAGNERWFCANPQATSAAQCQIDKFIINVVTISPGVSLAGNIKSNGLNVAGVFVFAAGFAGKGVTTTDPGGAYTLSSLPASNAFDITAVKNNYCQNSRFESVGTTNKTGIDVNINFGACQMSGTPGSSGGSPMVVFSGPPDGMQNVPTSTGLRIGFNQPMDASTINDNDPTNVGSHVYVTNQSGQKMAGTVLYCETPNSNATCQQNLFPMDNNTILFVPQNLVTGTMYTVVVDESVKGSNGQSVQGNRSGGGHNINFTTVGIIFDANQMANSYGQSGQFMPPFVKSMVPGPGMSVAPNTSVLLEFNTALDISTVNSSNIVLVKNGLPVDGTTVSLDNNEKKFVLISSSLSSGDYTVQVKGAVKSSLGVTMMQAGQGNSVAFNSSFSVSGSNDSTGPTIFPQLSNNATGVAVNTVFQFGFNEQLNINTVNNTNITMYRGATQVSISAKYDPSDNNIYLSSNSILVPNTAYTITFGSAVKDLAGNGIATSTYAYSTTAGETGAPAVKEARCDDFTCSVEFTEPMNHDTAADPNWVSSTLNHARISLTIGGGADQVASASNISYDFVEKAIKITGLNLKAQIGQTFTITLTGVTDLSGNLIGAANSSVGKIENSQTTFGNFSGASMFAPPTVSGGGVGSATISQFKPQGFGSFTPDQFALGQADTAFPFSSTAGQDSNVFQVRFAPGVVLQDDDLIVLSFPNGTNIASTTYDIFSPAYNDYSQFGTGSVSSTNLTVDNTANTITLTTNVISGTPNASDPLMIDLKKIINPIIPKGPNMGGYTVGIKISRGGEIIVNKTTMPYFINSGGSGLITIGVSGLTGSGSFMLHGGGPSGPMDKQITITNGSISQVDGTATTTIVYSGLNNGCYYIGTDPMVTLGSTDFSGQMSPEPLCVSNDSKSKTFAFTSLTGAATAPLTIKLVGSDNQPFNFGGKDLDIFAGGPGKFVVKTLSAVGVATSNGYTLNIPNNGSWMVGVGSAMPKGASGGISTQLSTVPPQSVPLQVSGIGGTPAIVIGTSILPPNVSFDNSTDVLTFTFATADKTVTGTVVDTVGNGIQNVNVFLHRQGFGAPTIGQSNASGTFNLAVSDYGVYEIGANIPGMPSIVKQIEIKQVNNLPVVYFNNKPVSQSNLLNLVLKKSSYTISGKVLDSNNNAVGGAPVSAVDANGNTVFSGTASDGSFTLFVDNGVWTVKAELPPDKSDVCGTLSKSVMVNGSSQSSQNLIPSGTCYTLDGTITVGSVLANVPVFIEEWNNGPVPNGYKRNINTNSSGVYSVKVVDGKTYHIGLLHPDYGELSATQAISGGNATKNINPGTMSSVTFNFVTGTAQMNAFVDLKSSTDSSQHISKKVNDLSSSVALSVPIGTYNYFVDISGVGKFNGSTSAGETVDLNLGMSGNNALVMVTGSVYVDSNTTTAKAGVLVVFSNASTTITAVSDDNGVYTAYLKTGSYVVGDTLNGYIGTNGQTVSFTTNTAGYNFGGPTSTLDQPALTTAPYVISGILNNSSGSPMSEGSVWAFNASGTMVTAQVNASGQYSLPVKVGDWTVKGVGPKHSETVGGTVTVDADETLNFNLTAASGNASTSTVGIASADSGGSINDTEGTGIKFTFGGGVLETGDGDVTLNLEKSYTAPDTASYQALGNTTYAINADGESAITNLIGYAEITLDFSSIQIPTGVNTSSLMLAYFSPEKGDYVPVEGGYTVDPTNKTITGQTNHLTDFVITYLNSTAGVTLTEVGGSTAVTEGGSTDTYTVVLTSQPSSNVTVTPSVTGAKATVSPTSLTFTTSNWNSAQTVTVTAVNNSVVDGTRTDTISHAISSSDVLYAGVSIGSITLTVTDNDVAVGGGSSSGGSVTAQIATPTTTVTSTLVSTTTIPVATTTIKTTTTTIISTTTIETKKVEVIAPAVKVLVATNPKSKVVMSLPSVAAYQPGSILKFNYKYKNQSKKKVTVKVVRQMLDAKGKVVISAAANKTIKAGAVFTGDIKENLTKKLKPGEYTMRVRIIGAKNKVLEENSFKFEVEKMKKKYFSLSLENPESNNISFDETSLEKVKSGVVLPIQLKLKYSYINGSDVKQKVRMVRELIGPNGKVIQTKVGNWNMKPNEEDSLSFTQPITPNFSIGNYQIRIRAYDFKTKKLIAENSVGFVVELR